MAGIALNCQCHFVSIMVPPELSLKEKNVRRKERKKYIISKGKRNAAFARLLIDCPVTAFRILIKILIVIIAIFINTFAIGYIPL